MGVGDQRGVELGVEIAGADGVDLQRRAAPSRSPCPWSGSAPRPWWRCRARCSARAERGLHRGDVDDLAGAARDHAPRATAWPTYEDAGQTLVAHEPLPGLGGKSSSGARCCMPALLTRMSIGPIVGLDRVDAARDGGVVGHVERRRVRPWRRRRAARPRAASSAARRGRSARRSAPARPGRRPAQGRCPRLEPVTSASRPVRSKSRMTISPGSSRRSCCDQTRGGAGLSTCRGSGLRRRQYPPDRRGSSQDPFAHLRRPFLHDACRATVHLIRRRHYARPHHGR